MNLSWFMILAVLLLTAGCRTSSLASRKALHLAAYSALPLEMQRLVDQGQLRAGMDTDAVFIAWGPPAKSVSRDGATMIWLYTGGWVQKIPYWSFTPNRYGFGTLDLRVRPVARGYVRAEVVFQNGRVISWRTFAAPDD